MPANSYTFRANRITGHAEINNANDITCLRKESFDHRCDELLGFVETIYHLRNKNLIDFPVRAEFASPDAIITAGSVRFGLEVTRLEWQAQAQALNTSSGKATPITQALCVDKPLKNISKEDRLKVPGWIGGEMLSSTLTLFQARVQKKSEKLHSYRHSVTSNWLFLIANHGGQGDWDEITLDPVHRQAVSQICEASSFDKVLLYRWDHADRFENITILYSKLSHTNLHKPS